MFNAENILKIMTHTKLNATLGIAVGILFASGAATVVHASDATGSSLSPSEVFKKAQETYAALTSYARVT